MPLRFVLAFLGFLSSVALAPAQEREREPVLERSLLEGLQWLARHQQEDGTWSAQLLGARCDAGSPCADSKDLFHDLYDPGLTALAVFAFEECGYGPESRQRLADPVHREREDIGEVVEAGLAVLARFQDDEGAVTPGRAFSYNEAVAALAFVAAYERTGDERWRVCAQGSIDWLVRAQRPNPSGVGQWGWRYQSLEDVRARAGGNPAAIQRELHDSDTSVTAWAARALGRARRAGLTVPDAAIEGALAFTRWVTATGGGVGYIDPKGAGATVTGKNDHFEYHPTAMSALGMSTRLDLASDRSDPFFALAAARILRDLPRATSDGLSVDYYYWHAGTHALLAWEGASSANTAWSEWKHALVRELSALQDASDSGCRRGGWLQGDRWAYTGGPVYTTAINVLTLAAASKEPALGAPTRSTAEREVARAPEASESERVPGAVAGEAAQPQIELSNASRIATGLSTSETAALERALGEGLAWLARHQNPDGSWSATTLVQRCDASTPCFDEKEHYLAFYDEGATALALLAFLGAGYGSDAKQRLVDGVTSKEHGIGQLVGSGLRWLAQRQAADGHFTQGKAFLYNEALATTAFVEAFRLTRDRQWEAPAQKGVDFLQRAQRPNPSGRGLWGWRYQSREEVEKLESSASQPANDRELFDSDASITTWCGRALVAAKEAGLEVRQESVEGALAFLRWVAAEDGGVGYLDPRGAGATVTGKNDHFRYHSAVMSALASEVRLALGEPRDDPFFDLAAKKVVSDLPTISRDGLSVDYYYWNAGTQALLDLDGPASLRRTNKYWGPWRKAMAVALPACQELSSRGCGRGGFLRLDRWAYTAGPLYTTAINLLTIEALLGYRHREPWWKDATRRALVGEPARAFAFTKRDGTPGSSSELVGSVVVLDFFSPWMPEYKEEITAAAYAVAWHRDAPFALVGIGFVPSGDASEYTRRAERFEGTWHTSIRKDLTNSIFEVFDVRAFPTRIVIDAEGVIRGRDLGWDEVRELVTRLTQDAAKPK